MPILNSRNTGAAWTFAALMCAALYPSTAPAAEDGNRWGFTAELGAGIKHNNDGGAFLWRGAFGNDSWGGCGFVLGAWSGEFRNQVVGLNCQKRIRLGWFSDRRFYAGLGFVDISPGLIVNSSWAFEIHLRYELNDVVSLALTHYSNAGVHDPNRGYNFLSVEFTL